MKSVIEREKAAMAQEAIESRKKNYKHHLRQKIWDVERLEGEAGQYVERIAAAKKDLEEFTFEEYNKRCDESEKRDRR